MSPLRLSARLILSSFMTIFLFASSLSVVIVIVWKGLPILHHGIPMCGVLARENMLDRVLYTSCGCALVELVALPVAALGLYVFTPKLLKIFVAVSQRRNRR